MDNAMVKRGIGAVVLAIIAALLLGYLLKDKSRERQDVVEMELPGTATDSKIPSLSATADDAGSTLAENANSSANNDANNLAENASDAVKNTGATVVAAAAGTGAAVATAANNTADTASKATDQAVASAGKTVANAGNGQAVRPGFSIRPAASGEQRDTVNPDGTAQRTNTPAKKSAPTKNNVVASSGNRGSYKPRLIKERKTRIVSSSQGSNRGKTSRPAKHASAPAAKKSKTKSTASATKSSASKGGYAIQLMATASESRAKKLALTMKKEGYRSFIARTSRNGKNLFRVRVQAGSNRNSALSTQQKMKRRYQKNFFVQNSLVVSN